MLQSGFEMKIQMRGGDYIVHTVLEYWLSAVNTTSSALLPSGCQEDIFGSFVSLRLLVIYYLGAILLSGQ